MGKYTAIDDPSAYFQTATWSGNASTQSITNDGNSDLKPDWAWTKDRGIGYGHKLMDSSRGLGSSGKFLITNSTAAESAIDDYMMTFDTDGFSVGAGDAGFNASNDTYVTWQWKANGGTTASNSDGSLASVVQANTTAGFSIVTWTGAGSARTVGHGLGVAPDVKNRSTSTQWGVWHKDLADTDNNLRINSTSAEIDDALWNDTVPTSSVFSIGSGAEVSNDSIAYCFAEKQGYSKFGKYVGNGNTNGPFIYTGFKPAFVILKGSSASGSWYMLDSKRDVDNVANHAVEAQSSAAEYTNYNFIDMLSNGFKLRLGTSEVNTSGNTYIYMAFAENPFVTSTGIMGTAR